MFSRSVALATLTASLLFQACHLNGSDTFVMASGKGKRVNYEVRVATKVLAETPDWTPGKGPIPLSVEQAIAIGSAALRKTYPDWKEVYVISAELRFVTSYRFGHKGFYLLSVCPVKNGEPNHIERHVIGILMDGTLVRPTNL